MRRRRLASGLVTTLCVLTVVPSWPGEKKKNLDAESFLSKAYSTVDIKAAGSAPFVLVGTAHLEDGSHKVDGILAMSWAAPDRFREIFKFPDFTETDVASGGKLYIERSVRSSPLMIWELTQVIDFAERYKFETSREWTQHPKRMEADRTGVACMIFEGAVTSKICADAQHRPTLIEDQGPRSFLGRYRFGSYRNFGGKEVPYRLTGEDWGKRKVEFNVVKLVPVKSFAATEFVPPPGARTEGFCLDPKVTGDFHPFTGVTRGFTGEMVMYFEVSAEGGLQYADVIKSSDPLMDKTILHWFVGTHFPIETCNGKPMNYETVLSWVRP